MTTKNLKCFGYFSPKILQAALSGRQNEISLFLTPLSGAGLLKKGAKNFHH